MNKDDRQAMMKSMMEQFFGGMGANEKKDMCATMMSKMTEGLDMKEMMPKMMMGTMSGGADDSPGKSQEMTPQKMHGASQMPEMMLKTMMPHCIGMVLPAIDPSRRGEVAAALLSAIVEKGPVGMSNEQAEDFFGALSRKLDEAANHRSGSQN